MARWSKVEISGVNTSTLPVLSRDEAKALFIEAKAGSESARQTLIQGNLRLVLSVIKKFDGRNENPDDLFQVGCIGLIKGIDNFNPDMDVYPSTYLVPMILGEVRRYLRDSGSVRVSRSMRDTAYKVLQAKEKFIAEHQREPSVEEIAKILDIKREDVVFALDAIVDPVSLYEPIYSDGGDTICVMDQVRDQKNTDENWLEQIALKEAMDRLSDRERFCVCASLRARRRWKFRPASAFRRRRSPAWRKTPFKRSKKSYEKSGLKKQVALSLMPFVSLPSSAPAAAPE